MDPTELFGAGAAHMLCAIDRFDRGFPRSCVV